MHRGAAPQAWMTGLLDMKLHRDPFSQQSRMGPANLLDCLWPPFHLVKERKNLHKLHSMFNWRRQSSAGYNYICFGWLRSRYYFLGFYFLFIWKHWLCLLTFALRCHHSSLWWHSVSLEHCWNSASSMFWSPPKTCVIAISSPVSQCENVLLLSQSSIRSNTVINYLRAKLHWFRF